MHGRTHPDMPWFKVDDSFHAHPKAIATAPAALGLWVVAGSWSSANLTDGFVSDLVLPRLLPDAATLAKKLVAAGLWLRTRGGYQFRDWDDYNPTAEEVKTDRKKAAERQRKARETQRASRRDSQRESQGQSHVSHSAPARPVPSRTHGGLGAGGYVGDARENAPLPNTDPGERPAERCPRHADDPNPPACGACADARRTAERWDQQAAERRKHTKTALEHAKADHRQECEHGTAGGRFIHPDTGVSALCPACRQTQLEAV